MKKYLSRLLAVALPLAAFLMLAAPAFAQAVTFQPEGPYPGTTQPTDIVRSDLDLDGDQDLAAVSSATVTIFQNDGSGNYSTAPTNLSIPGATNPTSIDRGDFNGDKKPDLIMTDGGGNVYVLLNTNATPGAITFGAPISTSTGGSNPTDVAVGDLNQDGRDDLVATNQGSNTVAILISNGSGNFALVQTINLPLLVGTQPTAADAADFDGDGDVDVVIANQGTSNATLLRNSASGLFFTIGQTVTVGNAPSDITAKDFNKDGSPDFATANTGSDNVSVALGNGNGTFTTASNFTAQTSQVVTAGGQTLASELQSGNYNCDGYLDLAVTSPTDNIVQVLTGNDNGTFNGALPFNVGSQPSGLTSGNLDNQKGQDLATSNFGSNNISVLLNTSPNCGSSPLTLTQTDRPDPVRVGRKLTYTLAVTNNDPETAADVTITDSLPRGVRFLSASPGCANTGSTVTCDVGSLASGATATEQIVVKVNRKGKLTNTAIVQSSSLPPNTATATTKVKNKKHKAHHGKHKHRR